MKNFNYEVAINQLGLEKYPINRIAYDRIPEWVRGKPFLELFLPYLEIIGDSREQDRWIEKACEYYGIAFQWARKDSKANTENLKEGDYTYRVCFGGKCFDYTGVVAYERKGSVSELYNNCTGYKKENGDSDRDRIKRELERFETKSYKKVVLLLQVGEKLTDLIGLKFQYRGEGGHLITKDTDYVIYSSLMLWKQPNNKNFDIIQSNNKETLFWLFVQDCYYYFRNEIRIKCEEKGLIEKTGDKKC
jgi:hypothetical protein